MPASNVAVKAIFEPIPPNTYTVTFDPDGGTHTGGGALSQTITHGTGAIAPVLTKAGYTFNGWDNDFSNITAHLTVTAQWEEIPTVPEPPTPPIITTSGRSSSSGGGTSKADASPVTGRPFTKPDATRLFNAALAAKPEGQTTLSIKARNYTSVDKTVLAELTTLAQKNGVTLTVHFDTVKGGRVTSRISINPAVVTTSLELTVKIVGNKITLPKFAAPVELAVTMPAGMTIESLKITGDGKDITATAKPWLDKNRYLHFTATGGEIVLSKK